MTLEYQLYFPFVQLSIYCYCDWPAVYLGTHATHPLRLVRARSCKVLIKIGKFQATTKKIVWKRSVIIISCKENVNKVPLPLNMCIRKMSLFHIFQSFPLLTGLTSRLPNSAGLVMATTSWKRCAIPATHRKARPKAKCRRSICTPAKRLSSLRRRTKRECPITSRFSTGVLASR